MQLLTGVEGWHVGFESERERFRELFEHTSDGVLIIDRSLRVIAANPAAERLTACRGGGVGTNTCNEVAICQNADGFELCESNCPGVAAIERGESRSEVDVAIPGRGGLVAPAACVPMTSAEGTPLAMILIRDVLDRTALEEQVLAVERMDQVSGMYARPYFEELYRRELRLAERQQRPLAALVVALSGDRMEGPEADRAIRVVADAIRSSLRRVDIAGRYDHATFAIVLLDADSNGATSLMARIQSRISQAGLGEGISIDYGAGTTGAAGYSGLLKAARQSVSRHRA